MKGILEAAAKGFFRELGEHTFKKATESFVTEGVKASFEIWKRRRIRHDEYEFAEWKKERAAADKENAPKKTAAPDDTKKAPVTAEPENSDALPDEPEEKPKDDGEDDKESEESH